MGNPRETFVDAVHAVAAEERARLVEHPSPEELMAYHAGELSEGGRWRLRRHLALCPACTQTVLDLAAFPEIEPRHESPRRSAEQELADWQAIETRLVAREAVRGASASGQSTGPRWSRSLSWPQVLAASLLIAVGGLSFWVASLRLRVVELSRPHANVFVSDLLPADAAGANRRGAGDSGPGCEIAVPAGMDQLVLLLNLDDLRLFADYRVEIADRNGTVIRTLRGLVRGPEGSFSIGFRRTTLAAGEYRIRLYGMAGNEQSPLATYHLRINYERAK